jgi:hypothetical protein
MGSAPSTLADEDLAELQNISNCMSFGMEIDGNMVFGIFSILIDVW